MFIYILISAVAVAALVILLLLISGVFLKKDYSSDALRYFDKDFLDISYNYQKISVTIFVINQIISFSLMFLIFLLSFKIFSKNYRATLLAALISMLIFFLALIVMTFLFSYYRGFIIEHRFGLSNQTFNGWFADYLKSQSISLGINLAAFISIYALIIYIPRYWWVISWAVVVIFIILGTYIAPIVIDPLFYKFKPLENENLKEKIISISDKANVRVSAVLVADASTKTKTANAYFTGIGSTKRIVLYDNLLTGFSDEETLSVVAHEIAHWEYGHIIKSLAIACIISFIGFLLLGYIIKGLNLYDIRGLFLIIILFSIVSFTIMPLENAISRRFESQADKRAQMLTQNYKTRIDLSVNLAKSNLSMVEPDGIVKAILYSHPPVIERIKNAIKWEEELK